MALNKIKEKNFISAVVYINNNEKNIMSFLENLKEILSLKFTNYEIICVNDFSTDNSLNVIKEFAKKQSEAVISVINMSYYHGLEQSMNAGTDLAIGDFVYEFDYIYQDYDINMIYELYETSLKGYDVVRLVNKNKKEFLSSIYYKIFNMFSKNEYRLESEVFRILSRRGINRIHSLSTKIPYRKALYRSCGLKMETIYYKGNREVSNVKIAEKSELGINSLILFTNVAYKISLTISVLFMISLISTLIYTIIIFSMKNPVPGYTSMMLVMSGAFFGVFLIFAIIIKYLSIIIELIFKKQQYLIESIEKISK